MYKVTLKYDYIRKLDFNFVITEKEKLFTFRTPTHLLTLLRNNKKFSQLKSYDGSRIHCSGL